MRKYSSIRSWMNLQMWNQATGRAHCTYRKKNPPVSWPAQFQNPCCSTEGQLYITDFKNCNDECRRKSPDRTYSWAVKMEPGKQIVESPWQRKTGRPRCRLGSLRSRTRDRETGDGTDGIYVRVTCMRLTCVRVTCVRVAWRNWLQPQLKLKSHP